MTHRELLQETIIRLRYIADDCFDLTAARRLRQFADEIERTLGAPPPAENS